MFATKQDFVNILQTNICRVVFKKKDGSERVMNCTLIDTMIRDNGLTPFGTGGVVPENQVRCIDVDIMEWRSFLADSVLDFQIIGV